MMLLSESKKEEINEAVKIHDIFYKPFPNLRTAALTGTIYAIRPEKTHDFQHWCIQHGIKISFKGHFKRRVLFQIVHDPYPALTMMMWS